MTDYSTGGIPLLVLDLETAPLPEAASFLEPVPEPKYPDLDKRFTDPAKIAADKAAKDAQHTANLVKWEQTKAEQVNACALNPDLAQIIAIGASRPNGDATVMAQDIHTEALIIAATARTIGPATIVVGFNVRFDLAMLQRRALYLGVPFPAISLDKYRHPHLIDLQDVLSFDGYLSIKGKSLDWWAKRFALDVPEDPTGGGAEMPSLYAAGDWASIRRHCEIDILKTRALAERLGVVARAEVEAAF